MAAPVTMPGAYFSSYENSCAFSRPFATPSFYAPPSPSASSALSSSFQSISRTSSTSTFKPRKRSRNQISNSIDITPRRRQTITDESEVITPGPLVNTDYRIDGGLDTPCLQKLHNQEQDYEYERDHRTNRCNQKPTHVVDSYFPLTPPADAPYGRKRKLSAPSNPGWTKTVWNITGGVAGKVINFCWNTAFHGFHAGGGRAYDMQLDTPTVTAAYMGYLTQSEDVFDPSYRGRGDTPIPGDFPQSGLIEDYMLHPAAHQQIETPTQTNDPGVSSLRSNWVMVEDQDATGQRSPARKPSRPSTASMYSRPPSRPSLTARPRLAGKASSGGASFASPRASTASTAYGGRPSSSEGTERQYKKSRTSLASPRRSGVLQGEGTPKSPEVVKFEKKLRKQSQKQDSSMRRMNQQLNNLVKEAQQALASKVEVQEYQDEDEGFIDGDHDNAGQW